MKSISIVAVTAVIGGALIWAVWVILIRADTIGADTLRMYPYVLLLWMGLIVLGGLFLGVKREKRKGGNND